MSATSYVFPQKRYNHVCIGPSNRLLGSKTQITSRPQDNRSPAVGVKSGKGLGALDIAKDIIHSRMMKRLFGPKAKSSKSPSQASPIPTPVPADQFARAAQLKASSQDDHWVIVKDHTTGPALQDRSRSASFTSLPTGNTSFPPTVPGANNVSTFQSTGNITPYDGTPHQSNHNLPAPNPNHTQSLISKKSHTMPGVPAILKSLDPERINSPLSVSASVESLTLNDDIDWERDPKNAEQENEVERERERHRDKGRGREKEREREREKGRSRDKLLKRESARIRDSDREREPERGRERDKDRDKPKDKERKKGLFGAVRDKEKERDRNGQAEMIGMIGYMTATASEDWGLVLDVCERASASETAARDASKALRREFKYAEPGAQLSAARLWAIMLRNCSETFIIQASNKKFLDTLEEVLLSGGTSPVVRERLLDVLAAAAFMHPGNGKEGYRALWKKVKPPNKPDEGIPFDEDDAMLNPSPVPIASQYPIRSIQNPQPNVRRDIISQSEDMRRLFEECELAKGNAQLLNQALTFAKPEDLSGHVIGEWYRKCRNSQDFIMAQIPWATAQADRSREEMLRLYSLGNGMKARPVQTSKEEELLAALLGANQDLLEVFRIYDDLERLGVAEKEEREVEERSRKDTRMDRTQIQFIADDGSFRVEVPSQSNRAGPSRSPSPSPTPSFSSLPPVPQHPLLVSHASNPPNQVSSHSSLTLPRPTPHGPRQARPRSRTPSPDPPTHPPALAPHSGSLGLNIERLERTSSESADDDERSTTDFDGERTPIMPSAKAMGKRKEVDSGIDSDSPAQGDDMADGYGSFGIDSSTEPEDESSEGPDHRWKKPMKYAYDAAEDRARELRRALGIPPTIANGLAP